MEKQGVELQSKVHELQAAEEEMRQMNDILEAQVETRTLELQSKVQELEAAEEEMRQINDNLEEMVEDRTRELQSAMEDLKRAQQQLIQSEKMASLGQLVAGVAHEINTPIGAVKASACNMEECLPIILRELPVFCNELPKRLKPYFWQGIELILSNTECLSTRDERRIRRQMQSCFEQENIENADEMAQKLVESGVIDQFERWLELLKHPKGSSAVNMLYRVGQMKVNLANISLAAEKTKRTVFALKSYSYKETKAEPQPVNLAENLKMILTLYENQLKYNVTLTLRLDDDVVALCNPDEMGQVWTNLLHNALQAIHYEGEIQVNCRKNGQYACVELIDNGPGIPPEIQTQIFEPFFTTKKRGEGTGLGLAICKEMLEKNGGSLGFETEPGRTCFRAQLPLWEAHSDAPFAEVPKQEYAYLAA